MARGRGPERGSPKPRPRRVAAARAVRSRTAPAMSHLRLVDPAPRVPGQAHRRAGVRHWPRCPPACHISGWRCDSGGPDRGHTLACHICGWCHCVHARAKSATRQFTSPVGATASALGRCRHRGMSHIRLVLRRWHSGKVGGASCHLSGWRRDAGAPAIRHVTFTVDAAALVPR